MDRIMPIVFIVILAAQFEALLAKEATLEILPGQSITKELGSPVYVVCQTKDKSSSVGQIKWFEPNGTEIPSDSHARKYVEDSNFGHAVALVITELTKEDRGKYSCSAPFDGNKTLHQTIEIDFYEGIKFGDMPLFLNATAGEDTFIQCKVTSNPPPVLDWLKDRSILRPDDRVVLTYEGILIHNIQENDSGTYRCRARVPELGLIDARDIQVNVYRPLIISKPPQNVSGFANQSASFQCEASGEPTPRYTWVGEDFQPLLKEDGYYVDEISGNLTVLDLAKEKSGLYKCIAFNAFGNATAEATLTVVRKPELEKFPNQTPLLSFPSSEDPCEGTSSEPWFFIRIFQMIFGS